MPVGGRQQPPRAAPVTKPALRSSGAALWSSETPSYLHRSPSDPFIASKNVLFHILKGKKISWTTLRSLNKMTFIEGTGFTRNVFDFFACNSVYCTKKNP